MFNVGRHLQKAGEVRYNGRLFGERKCFCFDLSGMNQSQTRMRILLVITPHLERVRTKQRCRTSLFPPREVVVCVYVTPYDPLVHCVYNKTMQMFMLILSNCSQGEGTTLSRISGYLSFRGLVPKRSARWVVTGGATENCPGCEHHYRDCPSVRMTHLLC